MTDTSSRPIRMTSGRELDVTCEEYNQARIPEIGQSEHPAICYSPFTHMAINNHGHIRPCNHTPMVAGRVNSGKSILETWRGDELRKLRLQMREYILDDSNCGHCIHQLATRQFKEAFARIDCDHMHTEDLMPLYPRRLTLELGNKCNLACITCNGELSSRIRSERECRPPLEQVLDDRFFEEMEEIIPHVEQVSLYGGEPFLMDEVIRIFEIIKRTGSTCSLTVSTNCMSLNERTKRYIEELNFSSIGMSMDACNDELHEVIRHGVKGPIYKRNHDWLIATARRKGINIHISATEHRKNWFELPEIFRYAQEKDLFVHINHCIEPTHITLYTLPTNQLKYVLDYLERQKTCLLAEYPAFRNLQSYDYLLGLSREELNRRPPDWAPPISMAEDEHDWSLGAPLLGLPPFDTPETALAEVSRLSQLDDEAGAQIMNQMRSRLDSHAMAGDWSLVWSALADVAEPVPA